MWIPLHRRPSFAQLRKPKKENHPNDIMANFLNKPKTNKLNCENVIFNGLEIGHASMQGYRVSMEDEYIIDTFASLPDHVLVAIMDGHAGTCAASFCSVELKSKIENTVQWKEYVNLSDQERAQQAATLLSQALVQAYEHIDEGLEMLDSSGLMDQSGCTAVSCIITPSHVICANLGDSRAVIGLKSSLSTEQKQQQAVTTISLTEDHKPSNPEEKARIEQAGGFVWGDRVNGELAMSRALGDFRYKNNPGLRPDQYKVICYPDIAVHERSGNKDACMLLACDGVFDVMSNAEAMTYLLDIVLADSNLASSTVNHKRKISNYSVSSNSNSTRSSSSNSSNSSDEESSSIDTLNVIPPSIKKTTASLATKSKQPTTEQLLQSQHEDSHIISDSYDDRKYYVTACEAAGSLIDLAFADGSTDNISAIVLKFL